MPQQQEWKIVELLLDGERRISQGLLEERSARLASFLDSAGIESGARVCYLMENCIEVIETIQACQTLGAYPVPINYHFKSEEIRYILENSGAEAVVGSGAFAASVADASRGNRRLKVKLITKGTHECFDSYQDAIEKSPPWEASQRAAPGVVIYTSGTTGEPKGVMRAPGGDDVMAYMVKVMTEVCHLGWSPVHLVTGPLYHSAPNAFALASLALGGRLVLMPKFEAERTLDAVERYAVTNLHLVPTMMHRLLALPEGLRDRYDLSSLTSVQHAAAPCPPATKAAMIEWWGPVIEEYYGSTETGICTYINSDEALGKPGSVGRAIDGVTVKILDDQGRDCPPGAIGEAYLDSPFTRGFDYHGDSEKKRGNTKAGMFTNGDMGFLDEDGYLFLSDRKADMIISGGVNIYPAEIEAVLHSHPAVADCAVFGIPDDEWGEAVHAVVELESGASTLGIDEIRRYCAKHLAGYKVPRSVETVARLPRQPSGKIFKRKLREPFWKGRETKIV